MAGLALPLLALNRGLSPATAGAAVAGYGIAQAVCSPAWGRAGDRRSLRRVVLSAQPAFTVIAAALTILASDGALFVVLATAQGTVALPFGALMRSFWARQPDLADVQHRASTFESAMTEVVLLGARLLVSLVSLAGLVMLGAVQAVLAAAGGGALARTPQVRAEPPTHAEPALGRPVGPLIRLPSVYLGMALLSASLGAYSLGLVLALTACGSPTWAAVGVAAWGLGSLAGITTFGRRVHADSASRATPWLVLMAAVEFATFATTGHLGGALVIAFVAGIPIQLAVNAAYFLLTALSSAPQRTEYLAWASTAIFGGNALGAAVAGAASGLGNPGQAAVIVGALAAGASVWPLARTRQLLPVP